MLLKELITALGEVYDSYTQDYKDIAGEPEISIDLFEKLKFDRENRFKFKGITPNIQIRKTYDGSTLVLTAAPEKKKKLKRLKTNGKSKSK